MKRRYGLIVAGALASILLLAACASPASSGEPIPGTWVDVEMSNGTATMPLTLLEEHTNLHFEMEQEGQPLAFMAYILDGDIQVRANACPPCGSRGFTLKGKVLDCDACHTLFDAQDGSGIEGPCANYPKALVPHSVSGGRITLTVSDLVNAYEETLIAG